MAGRMLLQRRDVRVRWALTREEAEAVIELTRCNVCVMRSGLATPVLAAIARRRRTIATIVLLDPEEWSSWGSYFEAGATSVLRASALDQLLDALSDATMLTFRTAPRIPFKTTVRFAHGDEGGSWRSFNISSSGIALLDFPPYALGSEVDLAIDIRDKQFEFNAVVSQILRVGNHRAVGLEFRDLSPEMRVMLEETVATTMPRASSEIEDFDRELDVGTVTALRGTNVERDARDIVGALMSGGSVSPSDGAQPWVIAACNAFSEYEIAAIRDPKAAPQWAQDAVFARLRVYQIRAKCGAANPPDADVHEVLAHCKKLADSAAGSDTAILVQVTNIRADLLRALYDPSLLDEDLDVG